MNREKLATCAKAALKKFVVTDLKCYLPYMAAYYTELERNKTPRSCVNESEVKKGVLEVQEFLINLAKNAAYFGCHLPCAVAKYNSRILR